MVATNHCVWLTMRLQMLVIFMTAVASITRYQTTRASEDNASNERALFSQKVVPHFHFGSDLLSALGSSNDLKHRGSLAAALTSITAAFDVVVFGLQAIESYSAGDFDTAAVEGGLMAVSSGQLALSVRAFRAYREARAAALGLQVASSVRGLSRLGGFYSALSVGLTASLIGGLGNDRPHHRTHLNWLSLLPRRLKPRDVDCCFSSADWQAIQSRTPGIALRRASGIARPHSSQ